MLPNATISSWPERMIRHTRTETWEGIWAGYSRQGVKFCGRQQCVGDNQRTCVPADGSCGHCC
jgi:hypothetical protein